MVTAAGRDATVALQLSNGSPGDLIAPDMTVLPNLLMS
jgi:hypothetical protein